MEPVLKQGSGGDVPRPGEPFMREGPRGCSPSPLLPLLSSDLFKFENAMTMPALSLCDTLPSHYEHVS